MPAFASLSLSDSVPVAHTFAPVDIRQGVAFFADRVGGIPLGYPVVSLSLSEPKGPKRMDSKGQNYKFLAKVVVPTLELTAPSTMTGIQPAPTKAYDTIMEVAGSFPARGTLLERKNARSYVSNLLAGGMVVSMIENLEAVF